MAGRLAERIAVVGVGYVGLPLVVALSQAGYDVVGYDIDGERVRDLNDGHDANGSVRPADLAPLAGAFSADRAAIAGRSCFMITVATPVTGAHEPDLRPLLAACADVAAVLAPGALVVVESTVYPGVTRRQCVPVLERSGLVCGTDFGLAYSPERVNPGDQVNTVAQVRRVLGGHDAPSAARAAAIYQRVVRAGVHEVTSIEAAELAKVVENAQRDLNIAFVNEVAVLCDRLGLDSRAVLDACATKWNFHRYVPGLVGGHCIAVDPHYLMACAEANGAPTTLVATARRVNDAMPAFVAERVLEAVDLPARIGILGLSYKADLADVRNTGVVPMVERMRQAGAEVVVHDPLVDEATVAREVDVKLVARAELADLDALVVAVAHRQFRTWLPHGAAAMVRPGGLVADVTGTIALGPIADRVRCWQL